MRSLKRLSSLLLLLILTPTVFLAAEIWHHHDCDHAPTEESSCAICIVAHATTADLSSAPAVTAADLSISLLLPEVVAPFTTTFFPIHARGPPSAV